MRVLLFLGGGLGNIVHALPAVEAIRRAGHDLTLWVGGEWDGLARFIRHDNICTGPPPTAEGYDRVFRSPFAFTGRDAELGASCPKEAEGSPIPLAPPYTEVEACMWFARVVGYDGLMPPHALAHATESPVDGRYVVIAPGVQRGSAVWLKKCYPHWGEVASALSGKLRVVFVGTKGDSEAGFDQHTDLCGKLGLWESSGVLYRAAAVVGPDNGLTALSAAMGVPTVVLWGPTDESKNRKFGPRVVNIRSPMACAPCQHSDGMGMCLHANCMRSINPNVVVETVQRLAGEGTE